MVRRRVLQIRIATAVSVVVLVYYFLWLLPGSEAPPVFLVAFLPFAFFSYRLVSKPAEQKTKNWLALARGVGWFTLLFCLALGGPYAYVSGGLLLWLLLMLAQLILITGASQAHKVLGRQPGDALKLVVGLVWGIIYCAPFLVYSGEILEGGGHGRRQQNEGSAWWTLRILYSAQLDYAETYHRGFTDGLNRLGPAGKPDANRANLVESVLAGLAAGGSNTHFTESGYVFTYTPGPPNAEGRISTYTITARPLRYRKTGQRSFFMDESGVVRDTSEDRAATVQDALHEIALAAGRGPRNENTAARTLRDLHRAQLTYAKTYHRGFTDGLNRLGPARPAREKPDAERADLVDHVMAGLSAGGTNTGFTKSGYVFIYTPGSPDAQGRISTYTITARPLQYKKTGEQSFFMDESGVIRATAEDRAALARDPLPPTEAGENARSTLRTLYQAQYAYAATYHRGFTDGLNRLGPARPAREPDAERADLVDHVMAGLTTGGTNTGFTKSGYVFTYTPGSPNAEGRITTFTITARPLQYWKTGRWSFLMDQFDVIRATLDDRAATAQDPPY